MSRILGMDTSWWEAILAPKAHQFPIIECFSL